MSECSVVWPRSPKTAEVVALAKRPASLAGCKVAFLWDYLFRGDEIFPVIERELSARYPDMTFVPYAEFGTTHGEGEHDVVAAMATRLRELGVDAVVSGMGC
jgi:hypothetical protein